MHRLCAALSQVHISQLVPDVPKWLLPRWKYLPDLYQPLYNLLVKHSLSNLLKWILLEHLNLCR